MPYPKIEKTDDPNVFTFRYFPSALDRTCNTAPSSGTVEHLGRHRYRATADNGNVGTEETAIAAAANAACVSLS